MTKDDQYKIGKPQNIIALIFSIALLSINIFRILRIPITIDETGYNKDETYLQIIQDVGGGANNHIFHSVLRKFFVELFNDHLFFIRFDSLLAHCLFLVFAWLLTRLLFKNRWWQLCSFLMLNLISPLIFDFWSLSRGYALGQAFMIMSIYYLFRYLNSKQITMLAFSLLLGILTVYSNFSFINYFVTLCAVIVFRNIIFKDNSTLRSTLFKEIGIIILAGALLAVLIAGPLLLVLKNGELSFLGKNGFREDTIQSLLNDGLYLGRPENKNFVDNLSWVVAGFSVFSGFYWLALSVIRRKTINEESNTDLRHGIICYLLLITPAISLIIQHHLLGINYLTDRTALFFIVLFALHVIVFFKSLTPKFPIIRWTLFLMTLVLFGYNFATSVRFNNFRLWWFNMDDIHVLERMKEESQNKAGKIKFHANWRFIPSFNYDMQHHFPGRFETVYDTRIVPGTDTTFDYYYICSDEPVDSLKLRYHLDSTFVYGGCILYKKN